MKDREKRSREAIADFGKIAKFFNLGPEHGINTFAIKGSANKPVHLIDAVMLSHNDQSLKSSRLSCVSRANSKAMDIYKKILELEISQDFNESDISTDERARVIRERFCVQDNMPYGALAFGRLSGSQEDVIIMGFVEGVTREAALSEIQGKVTQRIAGLN